HAVRVDSPGAGGGDHLRGAVDGLDHRVRPASGQLGGARARTAAEVDDAARGAHGDAVEQVVERAGAVVVEGEVRGRVPERAHRCAPRFVRTSYRPGTPCGVCTAALGCARVLMAGPGTAPRPRPPVRPAPGPCRRPGAPAAP